MTDELTETVLKSFLYYGEQMRKQQALKPTPDILKLRKIRAEREAAKRQALGSV